MEYKVLNDIFSFKLTFYLIFFITIVLEVITKAIVSKNIDAGSRFPLLCYSFLKNFTSNSVTFFCVIFSVVDDSEPNGPDAKSSGNLIFQILKYILIR